MKVILIKEPVVDKNIIIEHLDGCDTAGRLRGVAFSTPLVLF